LKRLLALLTFGFAAPALGAPPAVTLRTVVASGGLSAPVAIANAGDGSGRLFIAEQDGRVRIVTKEGALLATSFLNISPLDGGERGLLGLAFHPQYAANRKFYVFYTPNALPANYTLRVSEFLASAADPNVADAASERPIITIPHPNAGNHNGGQLAFGPEGYLYISTGDGGGGGDPNDNGQNINTLLGKLLRIDVNGDDFPADADRNYATPPTNPFVGVAGADEIWAYGLRNPWRFSFDRMTVDLLIADVGQGAREEVNFEPAGDVGGRNYGWDDMEGSICHEPTNGCLTAGRVLPILEHTSGSGWHAIIGGYVYRGRKSAALRGFFIYGDHYVINLYAALNNGDGSWSAPSVLVGGPGSITAFGEDETGELYVVSLNGSLRAIDGPNDPLPPRKRGDLNADARADVLWRNVTSGDNYAYLMSGTAIQGEGYLRAVPNPAWKVAATGDFDGDGKTDVLWRNTSTGENYLYLMNGTSIAGEGYIVTVADQNWQVAGAGDFNGDGRDDILWRNVSTGENYVFPMNGLAIGAGEGYLRTVANLDWKIAGIGDVDGDGRADIVWRNSATGENYLFPILGLMVKPTEGYVRTVANLDWKIAGIGDFNGDGKADLLWRNASTGENYIFPMVGNEILGSEGYLRSVTNLAWEVAQIGDFDGDGKSDILWRNTDTGENYVYLMDGTLIAGEAYLPTVADQNWTVVPGPQAAAAAVPVTIYGIKNGSVAAGTGVRVQNAIVTAARGGSGFFIQVKQGDAAYNGAHHSGIFVFDASASVVPGSRVDVVGTVQSFSGQIQLAAPQVTVLGSPGEPLPVPVLVGDPADIATGGSLAANLEAVLVAIENVTVTATNQPGNEFTVTGNLRVDDFLFLVNPRPPVSTQYSSMTGVLATLLNASKLLPRAAADLVP